MTDFFTSDLHIFHEKICEYCDRPYATTEKMWRGIKKGWNEVVEKDDIVWIAGDLTLKREPHKNLLSKMLAELKGNKHLIIGNHDLMHPRDYEDIGFLSVHYPAVWHSNGYMIGHDPALAEALEEGTIYLCGHQHNMFNSMITPKGVHVVNVGVDVRDFKPMSETQVKKVVYNGEPGQIDNRKTKKQS